jgi:alpha-2-macroglobulin
MKLRLLLLLLLACLCSAHAQDRDKAVSFNLSTSRSYAPGEQPKIHLYTHNVDALEFRVYRVEDPVRFIENLRELHSFGDTNPFGSSEQIDERTWIEKFHDWKLQLWEEIRDFFRLQFSHAARSSLRAKQAKLSSRSRIVSAVQFAQIPLLNDRQLVARWRQIVPATYISDSNDLAVKDLTAGLYLVEATDGQYKAYTLLMISHNVLVTRTGPGGMMAYVVDHNTGVPVAGVNVAAGFGQKQADTAITDKDGVAVLSIPGSKTQQDNFWVVGSKGAEIAVATPQSYSLNYSTNDKFAAYIYADRPVYRPTHTVHFKAILREHQGNLLVLPKLQSVHVTVVDDQSKTVFERSMPIDPAGFVAGDFDLPKDAALGYYSINVGDGDDRVMGGDFHVEEYRKPEYRVQVSATSKRVLQGTNMAVTIDSRYFFGEPVANGKVKYRIYRERHYWWGEDEDDVSSQYQNDSGMEADDYAGDAQDEKTGKLDADGRLVIQVPTPVYDKEKLHADYDYTVEAGVTDEANREVAGRGRFLATYGTFRVNVEPVTYAVHAGDSAKFRITAIDYNDKPVQTHVHVALVYRHYENGKTETTQGAAVDVSTDASGKATGEVLVQSKQYSSAELEATASAVQPGTRDVSDNTYLWIMGAGESAYGEDSTQTSQIVADKKSYAPGDIAHLSLISETAGFHALIVVQGDTVLRREVITSQGRTLAFDIPITNESQPNITVDAIYVKDGALYQASKIIKVPPAQQQLQVQITSTRDTFQPQQKADYDVTTLDFAGKPVSADLSFGVVDEAIYSIHPDASGDMLSRLYPQRYDSSSVDSSLSYYFSGEAGTKSPMLAMRNARYRPQLAQVKPGNEDKPRVRKAFPDTAFWAPSVHTDASGHARVTLTFPDSLTTWRATVHAITEDSKAGSAMSRVLVRKNILVRMGTPRFLVQGDEIVIPVIVHNYLDTPQQAKLSLVVDGLDVLNGADQSVTVPSRGEATVQWKLHATQIGTAKLTASAITPVESDALEITLPVEAAGVVQTVAHSGVIPQSADHANSSIFFPQTTDAAAHSLRIEVNSSIAGSLVSALDYLTSFPYGCTEQTMSSFLPNVIVAETLGKLPSARRVDEADLRAKMEAGLDRLADYQHDDGGWGWWKEDASQIFMTAYVIGGIGQGAKYLPLHGKQLQMLNSGQRYLATALRDHPKMRPDLRAAVLYALAEAGDPPYDSEATATRKAAMELEWDRRKDLQPESLAMTGLAMLELKDSRANELESLLESSAIRQGNLVHWTGSYLPLLDAEQINDAEATAYAVRLIAKIHPDSPLLPSAAQWLMLERNGDGWWQSTEQTAMVLFGLVDYIAASHELDADFTVEALVNGRSVGQRHFKPADALSGAILTIDLDSTKLQPGNNNVQIVRHGGSGRIYWRASGRYYTTDRSQYQAGTLSLNLTRDYYKLQPKQKDGRLIYTLEPLTAEAQIGDVLAVHEAINGSPMKYLLLEDPIPAGTEFVRSEDSYPIETRPGGWYEWYTRREFHDDRAAFFSSSFSGRQEIFYLIKVVNPGSFRVNPARVAPMYQPGVQATSDAFTLSVPSPSGGAH